MSLEITGSGSHPSNDHRSTPENTSSLNFLSPDLPVSTNNTLTLDSYDHTFREYSDSAGAPPLSSLTLLEA